MEHHILFAFVSLVTERSVKHPIHYDDLAGEPYTAVQTNESAIVFKERELRKKGAALERIFFLVSRKAASDIAPSEEFGPGVTHVAYLEKRLHAACPELDGRIQSIPYEDDPEEIDRGMQSIASIADIALGYIPKGQQDRTPGNRYIVHADMTGGYRHASVMMISILQMLSFYGIEQGDILYSDQGSRRVYHATPILQLTKLLSGMDEFVRYGSVDTLEDYFGTRDGDYSTELYDLITAMHTFSDAIRLCATGQIVDIVETLGKRLHAFHALEEKCIEEQLFDKCTDILREDYGALLHADVSRLDIIDWCGKHRFWQQQLTLSTEWLPEYLVDHQLAYTDDPDVQAFCAAEGTSMYRTWKQDFIITYNGGAKTKKQKQKSPLEAFKAAFYNVACQGRPTHTLIATAKSQGWTFMAEFLQDYAQARPRFQAAQLHPAQWDAFAAKYPALMAMMRLLHAHKRAMNGYHKTFEEDLCHQDYGKIPNVIHTLPKDLWSEKLLKTDQEDDAESASQTPAIRPEDEVFYQGASEPWKRRLTDYLRAYHAGILKSRLPLPQCLEILRGYFDIRVQRNQMNHANVQEAISDLQTSGKLHAYLDQLRACTK